MLLLLSCLGMKQITLITGGARSGKSAHALQLANSTAGARRYFIATAEALDDEMRERIEHHRRNRPPDYVVIEEPRNLAAELDKLAGRADVVVLDCLTLWISNLMATYGESLHGYDFETRMLTTSLAKAPFSTIVVTDEVGAGIVPDNPASRHFRDLLGRTNQRVAEIADAVLLMVAGIPLKVK